MLETIREFAAERLDELADVGVLRIVMRPSTSRSSSARARNCAHGELASGSTGSTRSTRTCGRRSSTCWRARTRTVRCGCRERSGCTGDTRALDRGPALPDRRRRARGRPRARAARRLTVGRCDSSRCGRATSTKASSWRPASSRSRRQRRDRSTRIRWRSTCLRSSRPDGVIATGPSRGSRSR